ncbi:serine/threonine-protein kinase TNNI3K-like [Corticium candelabrum]|uniref:serine/threonine-protein kinase TNNI3K-like n=1 Tax=Corticium candelabrum TaxID=121492 RepID=UPI002E25852E|nr:serine/threonine-protein kinase TNNI3K-like [Corticium candelabrum]
MFMGAYKSRPATVCADEWKRKFAETYAQVRSSLVDDTTVQLKDEESNSLHRACSEGKIDVVQQLARTSNVNEEDSAGLTCLHLSCITGAPSAVLSVLLERGAKTSLLTNKGFSCLHLACYKGATELVRVLIESKADIHQCAINKVTSLHIAAMCGHQQLVQILLQYGHDVDQMDAVGFSALHLASYFGNTAVIDVLLRNRANINHSGEVGDRPLHMACFEGHLEAAERLLQGDDAADAKAVDHEKHTPLHVCCRQGHLNMIELLLYSKSGLNPHSQTVYGDTALHYACYGGHLEVAQKLIEFTGSQSLLVENIFSETPFHAACTYGESEELVQFLLRQPSVDINRQGQDGHTALHSACYHNHSFIVELLMEEGADPTIQTYSQNELEDGETCADWAYERGFDNIVLLIKSKLHPQEELPQHDNGYAQISKLHTPSRLGKLRSITREKADVLRLRSSLPRHLHLSSRDIEIIEAVGSGSFGRVFRGRCQNKIVAIKKYRSSSASPSKSDVDMFCREVSILSSISHPNVIKLVGACLEDPSQFAIVTQYVGGGSLYLILHEQKRFLDESVKLGIAVDVARGMCYLHQLPWPIIHRDLNSRNILIDEQGGAVVSDFGESRYLKASDDDDLTKQPGNLRWMAPEIFTQSVKYNVRADVFSYSLSLWELFSGELPFGHLKPAAAATDMAYRNKRPSIPMTFPSQITMVIQHGWDANPESRPDFSQILETLEPLLDQDRSACMSVDSTDDDCFSPPQSSLPLTRSVRARRHPFRSNSVGDLSSADRSNVRHDNYSSNRSSSLRRVSGMSSGSTMSPSACVVEELTRRLALHTDRNGYVSDPFATRRRSSSSYVRKKSSDRTYSK